MKRLLLLLTTILACTFLLVNCGSYKKLTAEVEVLFRNKWKLTELQGKLVPDSLRTSFEFTPQRISGSTDCNWMSAGFLAGKHQTITIVPDTIINKACNNENAASLAPKIQDALSKSTKWDLKGGELWLGNDEMTLVKLRSL